VRLPINRRVLYTFLSLLVVLTGSYFAIRYAKGDRLNNKGIVQGTGLLAANSFPAGAEVYVDGRLIAVTDNNAIYLEPKEYHVEIKKDGYMPWQKNLNIQAELVTQTNAQLFRLAPSLTPMTFTGVKNISASPDGQKLLYYTASASAKTNNGLYVLDLSNGFLSTAKEPRQIAEESPGFDLGNSTFIWSPDDTQVIVSTNGHEVLLDVNRKNVLATLPDIAFKKKQLLSQWESQLYQKERQYFSKFPDEFINIATQSAKNIYLSPDKKKAMYTATSSATLPLNLAPPLPASNTQPEIRTLTPGQTYVYDREEDKNFLLSPGQFATASASKTFLATDLHRQQAATLEASPSTFIRLQATSSAQTALNFGSYYSSLYSSGVQWFPNSRHLLFTDREKIYLMEYDNTNKTPIYAGPFADNFIYPWPDGSKMLILTSFGAETPMNLYAIELK
jgi:hypothetical protein